VIAIVDDGVDIEHPELQANIWVNPKATRLTEGRNFFDKIQFHTSLFHGPLMTRS